MTHVSAGTYDYTITQTDRAGNVSASTAYTWVRDGNMPSTPTISSPSVYTTYSNGSSLTVTGTCMGSDTVTLLGDVLASEVTGTSLTKTCTSGVYSFEINKSSDSTYSLSVYQTDTTSLNDSAIVSRVWVRDTVVPGALVIVNPAILPYNAGGDYMVISGTCEDLASVQLTGDYATSVTCSGGYFRMTVPEGADATYNYSIKQVDRAQNSSSTIAVQWIKDSSIPASPEIYTPPVSPYRSGESQVTITGACAAGMTVILSGDVVAGDVATPSNSLSQVCNLGQWRFVVNKSSDATYTFNIKQRNGLSVDSPNSVVAWIRDTGAPVTTINTFPSSTNLSQTASFTFSANETVSGFLCSLDAAQYSPCSSPVSYSNLANGSHSFAVKATDLSQNTGTAATYSWTQSSGKTIALYHFDTSPGVLVDSSNYTSPNSNTLTDTNTTAGSSVKFGQSRTFNGTNQKMSSADTASQALLVSTFTVEMWINYSGSLSNNKTTILVSKMGGANNLGWQFGLKRLGSNNYLSFDGSSTAANGVTTANARSTSVSISSGTWYHVAFTYNKGNVSFFLNGVAAGSASISGSAATSLFNSTGPLTLGATDAGQANVVFFGGTLDEVRISQAIRYVGAFTPSGSAFSAD